MVRIWTGIGKDVGLGASLGVGVFGCGVGKVDGRYVEVGLARECRDVARIIGVRPQWMPGSLVLRRFPSPGEYNRVFSSAPGEEADTSM